MIQENYRPSTLT